VTVAKKPDLKSDGNPPLKVGTGLAGPGRPKGCANKVTRDLRKVLRDIVEETAEDVIEALQRLKNTDPAKFLEIYLKATEFVVPKLGRIDHVVDGGLSLEVRDLTSLSEDAIVRRLAAIGAGTAAAGRIIEAEEGSSAPH
jgi:hypothetical protein